MVDPEAGAAAGAAGAAGAAVGVEPLRRSAHVADLARLVAQAVAGNALCEDLLDEQQPGWDAPRKPKSRAGGPGGALQYIRSGLHSVWTNASWMLIHEYGMEPWKIPPLATRDNGTITLWQFGPNGDAQASDVDSWEPEQPAPGTDSEPVRPVWAPTEQLYTLEQARAILSVCTRHDWHVEVDAEGQPVAVVCSRGTCEERRALG